MNKGSLSHLQLINLWSESQLKLQSKQSNLKHIKVNTKMAFTEDDELKFGEVVGESY